MKKLIILIAISNILLFSQTSKEEKLGWIKSRGDIKVTQSTVGGKNDIYRLEYPGEEHNILSWELLKPTKPIPSQQQ